MYDQGYTQCKIAPCTKPVQGVLCRASGSGQRRRSCATTSRRRRADCARLCASSAASRGPRWRVHALKRAMSRVAWWRWSVAARQTRRRFSESGEVYALYCMLLRVLIRERTPPRFSSTDFTHTYADTGRLRIRKTRVLVLNHATTHQPHPQPTLTLSLCISSVALHNSRHRLDLRWQVRLHHELVPGVAEGAGVGRREAKRGTRAH